MKERALAKTTPIHVTDRAKAVMMTPAQQEEQRRSFAFGNTKIENERVTRETIDQAADALEAKKRG